MNGTNGKKYYTVGFRIYTKLKGMQRIDYRSSIELNSNPSVEKVTNDILETFGPKLYNSIDRIFVLVWEDDDTGAFQTLWYSDLKWEASL